MYDKLLALLLAKFPQARKDGLQQLARSLTLQATTDEEAQALVDKLQNNQVTDFIKDYRKTVDTETSNATKSFEQNLKAKFDFVEKKKEPNPTPSDPNDIQAVIAQAVKSAVEPLQTEISNLKQGKATETRMQTLEKTLQDVPQAFKTQTLSSFKRMKFEDDEAFNAYLSEVENNAKALSQEVADSGLSGFPKPPGGGDNVSKDALKESIKEWADSNKD